MKSGSIIEELFPQILAQRRGKSLLAELAMAQAFAEGRSFVMIYPDHFHVFTPSETRIVKFRAREQNEAET